MSDKQTDLRRQAEEMLLKQSGTLHKIAPVDMQGIVHELRVHQIELEIQNEELRSKQQELEASREKYFDLYDLAPVGYITLNEKGIIREANLTAAALLGQERSYLIKQPLMRFISKEDQDIYYFCNKRLFETRQDQECELRMLKGDGTLFWARLKTVAARFDNNKSLSRAAIIDITRSKQADDQYREHMEGLVRERSIALETANEEYKMLSQTQDELQESIAQQTAEISHGKASLQTEITERKRSDDEIIRLNENLLIRNEQLELANKKLESFIYAVSHDLRAPLRHISGFTDLVMKHIADKLDDKGKQYLTRIRDGAERMGRLIDELLNLSKISRQGIRRREINVSEIAGSIVADLRDSNPGRSVDVDIKEGLKAFADRGLIEVVLSNLFGNAWKFTATTESARIEFGTIEQGGKIIYYIKDNGVGFDPKFTAKMFLPFHRLHSESAFKGTGIGLAIVERIIRGHGGKIWAEGIEGKGATVYFSLM